MTDTLLVKQGQTEQPNSGEFAAQSNAVALNSLLDDIEGAAISNRDKGTRFERLCVDFLIYDKTYRDQFLLVQTFKDWAATHPHLASSCHDTGIDLVATNNPNYDNTVGVNGSGVETFTAIQCKFYAKNATVPKSGIDSFISASSKSYFTQRLIIATNEAWSVNVLKELYDPHSTISVTIITRIELEHSSIDWGRYQVDPSEVKHLSRELRSYQVTALEDVLKGFRSHDRGKLIMACGTGKTYTSLKIAEQQAGPHGFVLFLVPSLSLLAQTLTDWKNYASEPITAFAVCSDSKVGKKTEDRDLTSKDELAYPATTDPIKLAEKVCHFGMLASNQGLVDSSSTATPSEDGKGGMTVIFATYQSIEVVAAAQQKYGLPEFDLVICDEAHRTTGCYEKDTSHVATGELLFNEGADTPACGAKNKLDGVNRNISCFNLVHDQDFLRAKKRLYMTATPKVYVDRDHKHDKDGVNYDVFSMDNEAIYGPVFHVLNFSTAIQLDCLVDYQVIVLMLDGSSMRFGDQITALNHINQARIVGAWKALNKFGYFGNLPKDSKHIKRSVGFAQIIDSDRPDKVASKKFTNHFQEVINTYVKQVEEDFQNNPNNRLIKTEHDYLQQHPLQCVCDHIDGRMDVVQKSSRLNWLKEEPEANQTKILFNVRCLSEGVDVPALDAVIFFSPRKSQVEVVQSVGRVMRKAPGKEYGYIILPVVVNDPNDLDDAIYNTPEFATIWQVLMALKSLHSDEEMFDPILNKLDPRIQIVCEQELIVKKARAAYNLNIEIDPDVEVENKIASLLMLCNMQIVEHIQSAIITRLGSRRSWAVWAGDVAQICQDQVAAIYQQLQDSPEMCHTFNGFKDELSNTLRTNTSEQEVIEMLAQHIVVKPVLDELFKGFPFTEKNPIAHAMTHMVQMLDQDGLIKANRQLKEFYASVAVRMRQVTTLKDRQAVIIELFDNFFKKAFPKLQEKLGIVYTPVEVVDFINHSVNDILRQEFGQSLAAPNVHILDPFTGTGTFITRMLLDAELIPAEALDRKYYQELHAYELMPLAYYVAAINMESAFVERTGLNVDHYQANNIIVLTDTFADKRDFNAEEAELVNADIDLARNKQLRDYVDKQPLWVILGNPPYSVGQSSPNDDNQNSSYPALEKRLADTYVYRAGKIKNKTSLYDSYIKAFRWSSDNLGAQGVIAFVSNAGWLDSAAACGMRRCLTEEFSSVYVYHLKGDARTSGEQRRKEKDNIFGVGSRSPIAITILVKNPQAQEKGKVFFGCVDDYLNREGKLKHLEELGSIYHASLVEINQDEHGDWLNQRRNDFAKFMSIGSKVSGESTVFKVFSNGVKTNREAWSFNASRKVLAASFTKCIGFYNSQLDDAAQLGEAFERNNEPANIKWTRETIQALENGVRCQPFSAEHIERALYRPFFKEFLYNDKFWIGSRYQMPKLFPFAGAENLTIDLSCIGAHSFSCLMADGISCFDYVEKSQCFPRYIYRKQEPAAESQSGAGAWADAGLLAIIEAQSPQVSEEPAVPDTVVINGYIREDAIKPTAVAHFKQAYPDHATAIDADSIFYYIYGLLHSEAYRSTYANNLQKELPRIPRVATYEAFAAFEQAGRQLAKLHVGYEMVEPYAGCTIEQHVDGQPNYQVTRMSYGKIEGKVGNAGKDKTVIYYNDTITIRNIPLEVQEYVVSNKSALDWVVERCCVSQDADSKIINNYNDYAREVGDDKYIFNLVLRVITVSLETMRIVKALPKLDIHPLDR